MLHCKDDHSAHRVPVPTLAATFNYGDSALNTMLAEIGDDSAWPVSRRKRLGRLLASGLQQGFVSYLTEEHRTPTLPSW